MAKEKYISLKEAAALSGYTPDYVGQLIRRGKLPGKQVFSHVAWMTTEESLHIYLEQSKKGAFPPTKRGYKQGLASSFNFILVYKTILVLTTTLVVIFTIFLIYVFSVSLDKHIDQTYQLKIQHI